SQVRRAEEIPAFLLPLRDRAAGFAGIGPAALEHALVTEYGPGGGIGWHRDRPVFDDVIGISLGVPCRFRLRRKHGTPWQRGAIVGFSNFLLNLYAGERPRAVLVGWDTLGAPTYRQKLFPAYQGGREFDDELVEQLEVLPELVAACGFANAKAAGYEADDFLAAAVAVEERRGGNVLVASGDRDAFQLASDRTTILHPVRAGEMARIGPAEVRERYAVEPKQVPDFIALRGDPSDRLPGARGVGPK